MTDQPERTHKSAAELLADWRAAGRDTVAAKGAATVAGMALAAAAAAEEAANEVEVAASAALEAVERARSAALRAKHAAVQAAEAATLAMAAAGEDKSRTNRDVEVAGAAETTARDRFHAAQDEGFPKD